MKKIVLIGLLPVLLMPVMAMAQSDFGESRKWRAYRTARLRSPSRSKKIR